MVELKEEKGIMEDRIGYWKETPSGSLLVTPLVSEEMLASFFLKMSEQKLLDRTFNEGKATLKWYLDQYYNDKTTMLACMKEDENKKLHMCGMGWVNFRIRVGDTFERAEVGEAFFRKTSPKDTIWFGRMMIDYCFKQLNLDAITGLTAGPNWIAVKYARAIDFEVFGPIPYGTTWVNPETNKREVCDAYLSVFSKERWANRSWR